VLFLATEAVFQALWEETSISAEQLWTRHANLE
jgi:6-phospho-3-hexuloisomerase